MLLEAVVPVNVGSELCVTVRLVVEDAELDDEWLVDVVKAVLVATLLDRGALVVVVAVVGRGQLTKSTTTTGSSRESGEPGTRTTADRTAARSTRSSR